MHSLFGLDERGSTLVVGPTLAAADDGLEISLVVGGQSRRVRFSVDAKATRVEVRADGQLLDSRDVPHDYRWPSVEIDLTALGDASVIDVLTPAGS